MLFLVTGGNGFLGSHVCEALLEAGHRVRSLIQPGTGVENLIDLDVETLQGDLSDMAALERACTGCETVIHLAALAKDYGPWELFEKVNVQGTRNILEAAARKGARRFVFTSSLSIHGFHEWEGACEETPLDGAGNPYTWSKILGESLVKRFHREGKLEGVIARPGYFPFGPKDRTSFFPLAEAMEKGLYRRVGSGKAKTCTVYAGSLAEGMALCGTKKEAAGETFILADDGAPAWKELSEKIAAALGVRLPRIPIPESLALLAGDTMEGASKLLGRKEAPLLTSYRVRVPIHSTHFSNAKAKRLLGFSPKIGLDEGLLRTVEWYRAAKPGDRP